MLPKQMGCADVPLRICWKVVFVTHRERMLPEKQSLLRASQYGHAQSF